MEVFGFGHRGRGERFLGDQNGRISDITCWGYRNKLGPGFLLACVSSAETTVYYDIQC